MTSTNLYEIPPIQHPKRRIAPGPPVVRRARLTTRVEAAAEVGFVVITAPAGWGKTSLLADWAGETRRSVAWVACREEPREPTFLHAVVSAIQVAGVDISADVEAMLRSPRPVSMKQVVSLLMDACASYSGTLALVLDDFHLIDRADIQEAVYELATSGSENLAIIVAGRQSPGWPLARMRAHGLVTEFGIRDLAFERDEITTLLGEGNGDQSLADELAIRSEGWAAGIRLAQLWLRQGGDHARLLRAFTGAHRDIADYLAEEVLTTLPSDVERFLTLTAVPDAICAELANAITGNENASDLLNQVERQHLFLVPMDDERRWYRYHGIFREYLQSRLRQDCPDEELRVSGIVSRWFEDSGNIVEAARYALRAHDGKRATNLLEDVAQRLLLERGEAHTLVSLVEQLPDEMIDGSFSLKQFYAWALVLLGRLDEASALVEGLADATEGREAEIAGIRARIAAYRGDQDETITQAWAALSADQVVSHWFRADTLLSLGFAYRTVGKIDEALEAFAEAASEGWSCHFAHAALWGSRYQGITLVSQGRIHDAEELIEQAMERAASEGLDLGAALAALLIGRGEIRYERNDLTGARVDLERALGLARAMGDAKILMNVYMALSMLEQAEGREVDARATSRRAVRVFDGTMEKAHQAWIALRQGDTAGVRRWMDVYVSQAGREADLCVGEVEQMMLGRAMLEIGNPEATVFLETLLSQAESSGRFGRALVLRVLLARRADSDGDEAGAFEFVTSVVELAQREGYVRSILDEGPHFLAILRRWARSEASAAQRQYVASILDQAAIPGDGAGQPSLNGLVESLTSRQMDVLRLMIEGKSNRQIASELFVAEGTVKAHIHQIFGKLMVRNRVEAIRVAREVELA